MKFLAACRVALALLLVAGPVSGMAGAAVVDSIGASASGKDRAVTQVVKLLESMLATSKADATKDRELYAKFKCYCDDNEVAKTDEIDAFTTEIGVLESKIQKLQADSSKLSRNVAKLKTDMDNNKQAQDTAIAMRKSEKEAFDLLETDLSGAVGQMGQAIDVLSAIGADQSMSSAADHSQYMGGFNSSSLLRLRTSVKQALVAASATVSKKDMRLLESFLQAPFTGAYTSQSATVVGILKNMRDTFEANLESAKATEKAAVEAHGKYLQTMGAAYTEMETSHDLQQTTLGTNDDDLTTKKGQLDAAISGKADAEAFLEELQTKCAAKAKEYDHRVLLRSNEDAAISEAISILNNDVAFKTFGNVAATSTGATSFLQSRAISRHRQWAGADSHGQDAGRKAQGLLRKAAASSKSVLLPRILALLQAGNPFTIVLQEIEKMVALIAKEGEADDKQLTWCNGERESNNKMLNLKKEQILALEGEIETLTQAIEDPVTGLLATIKVTEDDLQTNSASQASETKERRAENALYQESMEHLVQAEELLTKAIAVLQKYYEQLAAEGSGSTLLQATAGPEPPATWEGDYQGQKSSSTDAVSMLEFILKNTKTEEDDAHSSELTSQQSYEDSMSGLKDAEATLQKSLKEAQLSLAETKKQLESKHEMLDTTNDDKRAIERYLKEIKPGCDFITDNIALRQTNRQTETQALTGAATMLKQTPAYQSAMAEANTAALGDCAGVCVGTEETAQCKACLAKVTVPAYCAGHKDAVGC
mmetsp:Transcript_82061/g.166124  ORF Transcript_82061/g.166124 Transcript_82061/m.166124 type:complete len:766 (+) Transcript_82061:65-2362(+)